MQAWTEMHRDMQACAGVRRASCFTLHPCALLHILKHSFASRPLLRDTGGGGWHEAMVLVCLPLAAPIGLSPLHIPTHCGSKRVLVVSTEPLDELSCLTTPGSAVPETGRAVDQVHPDAHSDFMLDLPTPGLTCALVCASAGYLS